MAENESLRKQLHDRDESIQTLESRVRELNQARQDISKRIDNLIAQIDVFESQIDNPEKA